MGDVTESDWKLFRKRLPGWQESYMEKLVGEYMGMLSGEGLASEKFWALEKHVNEDKRRPGVMVSDVRRTRCTMRSPAWRRMAPSPPMTSTASPRISSATFNAASNEKA